MTLQELQAKLDDRMYMEFIHKAIENAAVAGSECISFLRTGNYPNRSTSYLNSAQAAQLEKEGYEVDLGTALGSNVYQISGWTVPS